MAHVAGFYINYTSLMVDRRLKSRHLRSLFNVEDGDIQHDRYIRDGVFGTTVTTDKKLSGSVPHKGQNWSRYDQVARRLVAGYLEKCAPLRTIEGRIVRFAAAPGGKKTLENKFGP